MAVDIKNKVQVSAVLYMLPFSSSGKEIKGEEFHIDEHLILTKDKASQNRYRNLVRSDIKARINELKIFSLVNRDETKNLSIDSFAIEITRDLEKNKIIKKEAVKTNLSTYIKLLDILVYHFDNENQFLVLKCTLDDRENEDGYPIESLIKAHSHLMNNYFKDVDECPVIEDRVFDIAKDEKYPSSYLKINYFDGNNTYSYCLNSDSELSIGKKDGITFDFNNFHIRALSQMMLIDNSYDKKEIAEQLASGSKRPMLIHDESKMLITRRMYSLSTCFGSSLVYWKDESEDEEAWMMRNMRSVSSFYNEYLYDFLIALNYHIRVERQICRIGDLKLDSHNSIELRILLDQINEYRRITAKYYFINVSRLDYVNEWYCLLVKGLNTDALDEELETRLKYSVNYLTEEMNKAIYKENKHLNAFVAFAAVAGNIAIFVFTLLQVALSIGGEITPTILTFLIISGVIVLSSAIFGLFYFFKKRRVNKKYGND